MSNVYINPDTHRVSLPVDDNGEIEIENVPVLIIELTHLWRKELNSGEMKQWRSSSG
jgi:hypothetical protein